VKFDIWGNFMKICREAPNLIEIGQKCTGHFTWRIIADGDIRQNALLFSAVYC
jgi:hypothetical protein